MEYGMTTSSRRAASPDTRRQRPAAETNDPDMG
jgi:hypothetical protein